jgi:hypothetical protein
MDMRASIERGILVFSIWATLGFLGVGFWLEGATRDAMALSLLGIALILAAFVAHVVVNAVYRQGFGQGEAALGIGLYGLMALLYVGARLQGSLNATGTNAGLALFGVLALGFVVYLATRHGVRGAFTRFHHATRPARDGAR